MWNSLIDRLSEWLDPFKKTPESSPGRVGYYSWHFPTFGETFIQREINALQSAGLAVQVFAEAPEHTELFNADERSLMQETYYLLPQDAKRLNHYTRRFLFKNPILFFQLVIFTIRHRYSVQKNLSQDLRVFQSAVYLAGCIQDLDVHHLHSPWANLNAFIVLIASRLAGIPYSVQARASADLYRNNIRYALTEKFAHAKFILTNSQFNRAFIELYLGSRTRVPIHVIYEGLDLSQFNPPKRESASSPLRILSVARLIEEKGLVYLLQALKVLEDRGYVFRCEIVGAPDAWSNSNYAETLLGLWRQLELQESVAFVGALVFEEVLKKYAGADIFVLPSVPAKSGGRDVTPNALIEGMAMELAVVSTNISGIPEIVEHRVSGLLVPPRNERALAQALETLLTDKVLRQTFGRNARARVEEKFNIAKNILPVLELFRGKASTNPE